MWLRPMQDWRGGNDAIYVVYTKCNVNINCDVMKTFVRGDIGVEIINKYIQ